MTLDDMVENNDDKRIEEFGLEPLDRFVKYMPEPSKYMRRKITYAHRDFETVVKQIANKRPFAVVSGLNPSGPLHFGHKVIFDELLWLQKMGGEIYIPITNDETYVVNKSDSLSAARKNAYEYVIPSIIAFGFDPKKTHIFVDSDYKDLYNFAMHLAKKITFNQAKAIFGLEDNVGTLFYRCAVQLAQILLPQLKEFGGPMPTVIPVGIDQDPYILLSRDIAKREGMLPPAGLYLKFQGGLDGGDKMSKSIPGSALFLTDSGKEVERKILNAFTGGGGSLKDHQENGGKPEVCAIYSMYKYHFSDDKDLEDVNHNCKSGKKKCGDCKKELICKINSYLKDHQAKMQEAKKHMHEFILDTPIRSILKYEGENDA